MKRDLYMIPLMAGSLTLAACGTGGENPEPAVHEGVPTWEEVLKNATREFEGQKIYVVEGDLAVTLDELRARYERDAERHLANVDDASSHIGQTGRPSTVNTVGGADDIWTSWAQRRDLTYCISDDFGADKARTITEMANATEDWEQYGNFNFRYVPSEDASCDNTNTNILFSVRPWGSGGACAFFPSGGGCVPRTLVMNYSSFASGAVTSQGVFKHELGHILGLRHEHIRAPGTWCTENPDWRAVTAYDSDSVMHYPWCPGATNVGDLYLTADDREGVRLLYTPASAHGFAWVNSAAGVSALYSYNSEGGSVTATNPSAGVYAVTFADLGGTGGNVQVVGYGSASSRCKVASWSGTTDLTVNVRCHTAAGAPVNSAFVVQYARKATLADGAGAYVWANQQASASYTPSVTYSWNSTDGVNTITRPSVGRYYVDLPGLTAIGGTVQVTAYGSDTDHCKIEGWGPFGGGQRVRVRCFDTAGVASDARFALSYFAPNEVSVYDYGAYAWANDATSASYTPSTFYSYNSGDINGWPGCVGWLGDVEGGQLGGTTGRYYLWYEHLTATNSSVHVTSYGTDSSYCKVEGWSSSAGGVQVRTRCFTAAGAAVNTRYVGTYATQWVRGPC